MLLDCRNGTGGVHYGANVDLGLDITSRERWVVLAVAGEIDVATAPLLRERLTALMDEGQQRIVVDLQGVDFIDSTGLSVLLGILKRMRAQEGHLVLVCSQARVLKVFEITGLDQVFAMYQSVDEAVASA